MIALKLNSKQKQKQKQNQMECNACEKLKKAAVANG